jgi:hypothetical protein
MSVTVTKEHLEAARRAGACDDARRYRPGTPIARVKSADLAWFAERFPDEATAAAEAEVRASPLSIRGSVPLELLGSGSGSGSGSGDGFGFGFGDGFGDGYGDGFGDGYGYGYGSR